jgi:hypothetical protein
VVDRLEAKVDERFAKVDERVDHLDLQIGLMRDDVRAVIAHVESIAGYVRRDEMKDTDAG